MVWFVSPLTPSNTYFLVPFIPPYVPGYQSTLDISYYRINLVRAYTVAKGSNSTFSLEWFLNVITG